MALVEASYSRNVFINCPFDKKYAPIFNAIVFAVFDAGYIARTSLEFDDGISVRISNLLTLIKSCQYGIHDISRVQLDRATSLPRFNMPLELGIFLGAKAYGNRAQKRKSCLVFDKDRYRFRKFVSDFAGQDPHAHNDDPRTAVKEVRAWLATNSKGTAIIPGGEAIWNRYQRFLRELPAILHKLRLKRNEVQFVDYAKLVSLWLQEHP